MTEEVFPFRRTKSMIRVPAVPVNSLIHFSTETPLQCLVMEKETNEAGMAFNFEGLCRLCMKQEKVMFPIFTEENKLLLKLSHILPKLKIDAGDGLPSEVCQECVQQVDTCHYFLTQCEVSDTTFRKYLSKQIIGVNRELLPGADGGSSSTLRISSVFSLGTPAYSRYSILRERLENEEVTAEHLAKECKVNEAPVNLRIAHNRPQAACFNGTEPVAPMQKSGSHLTAPVEASVHVRKTSSVHKVQEAGISSEQVAVVQKGSSQAVHNSVPQSNSVSTPVTPCDKRKLSKETPLELEKPNSSRVTSQVVMLRVDKNSPPADLPEQTNGVQLGSATTTPSLGVLQKNNNSSATTSSAVKCSRGAEVGSVANIPPLVLLQKNRNVSVTSNSAVKLEKCGRDTEVGSGANIPPLVLLPKTRNSPTTSNSALKLEKCNNGADINSVTTIPPLVLLQKNRNTSTTSSSGVKVEKCNTGVEMDCDPNIPPLVLLNTNRRTASSSGVKVEKCNSDVEIDCDPNIPPLVLIKKNTSGLTKQTSARKLQKRNNRAEGRGVVTVPMGREDVKKPAHLKTLTSEVKENIVVSPEDNDSLKTYKYSKWKYFIPLQFLEQNSALNSAAKPVSSTESVPQHTCKECGWKFANKGAWWKHWQSHKVFRCDDCGLQVATALKLKVHRRQHTGEKPVAALCDRCGLSFSNYCIYLNHYNRHLGIKPFQCPECNKFYTSKAILKSHLRIHTGEKPIICEKCGWRFRDTAALIKHRILHDEHKRPYKCTLCPKTYRSKSSFKTHLMIHTGEKPFKCADCGSAFSHRGLLLRHRIMHTGERKYKCQYCEKSFTTSSSKIRHVRMHTGESPYKCSDCNRVFACRRYFTNHMLKVHGRKEEPADITST